MKKTFVIMVMAAMMMTFSVPVFAEETPASSGSGASSASEISMEAKQNVQNENQSWGIENANSTESSSETPASDQDSNVSSVSIDTEHFPDEEFRNYVSGNFDTDHNGKLDQDEQYVVTSVNVSGITALHSLQGLEYFPNLEELDAHAPIINNEDNWNVRFGNISEVDVSKNPKLKTLNLSDTNVKTLDLSNNTELESLNIAGTKISSMDSLVGIHKDKIKDFNLARSAWKGMLDVTEFTNLEKLDTSGFVTYDDNYQPVYTITEITGLAGKTHLISLNISGAGNDNFDLTGCDHLKKLDLSSTKFNGNNVKGFPASGLEELNLSGTQIEELPDISGHEETLQSLNLSGDYNLGIAPDISEFKHLKILNLSNMALSELGDCKSESVENLNLSGNLLSGTLDLSGFPNLKKLNVDNCMSDEGASLDELTGLKQPLEELSAKETNLDTSSYLKQGYANVEKLNLRGSNINGTVDLSKAAKLKYLYLDQCNLKGTLDVSNCPELEEIHVTQNADLTAIKGLENCPNLKDIYAYDTGISSIDLSHNPEMIRIDLCRTPLKSIDVTNMKHLFALNVEDTNVTSIDATHNPELYELYLTNDKIDSVDVSHNPELVHLRLSGTGVKNIDTSHNPKLAALYIQDTAIKSLDLSKNPDMFELFMDKTPIETIDLSNCRGLQHFNANDTALKSINIKKNKKLADVHINGTDITKLDLSNHPEIRQIECNNTKIKHLDLSGVPKLWKLYINNSSIDNLKNLDLSDCTNLDTLECENAGIETLKVPSSLSSLYCDGNSLTALELTGNGAYSLRLSPQNVKLYANASENTVEYSLKDLGLDPDRVTMKDGKNYSYDSAKGTITFSSPEDKSFVYDYITDTKHPQQKLMTVNAVIEKKSDPVYVVPSKENKPTNQKAIQDTLVSKQTTLTYNGKVQKPKFIALDQDNNVIELRQLDVHAPKSKNPGIYRMSVTGKNGVSGTAILEYRIIPAPVKLISVKPLKSKVRGIAVTWKKHRLQTSGFQVQYSTDKNFKPGRIKTVTKASAVKLTLKSLKAKKKYYVRVRSFKTVKHGNESIKLYSKWTKVKRVKVK